MQMFIIGDSVGWFCLHSVTLCVCLCDNNRNRTKKYGNLLKVTDYLKMQHVRGYMTCNANALCSSLQQKSNQGTHDSYLVTDFH